MENEVFFLLSQNEKRPNGTLQSVDKVNLSFLRFVRQHA